MPESSQNFPKPVESGKREIEQKSLSATKEINHFIVDSLMKKVKDKLGDKQRVTFTVNGEDGEFTFTLSKIGKKILKFAVSYISDDSSKLYNIYVNQTQDASGKRNLVQVENNAPGTSNPKISLRTFTAFRKMIEQHEG